MPTSAHVACFLQILIGGTSLRRTRNVASGVAIGDRDGPCSACQGQLPGCAWSNGVCYTNVDQPYCELWSGNTWCADTTQPTTTLAPTPPTPYQKIDVIGYYGNSGNALNSIPRITDVPCYYNVIIITFANFNTAGLLEFEIQGPYENNLQQMKDDIKEWKRGIDPYGRKRLALFSIGGQNGRWPGKLSEEQVEREIVGFIAEYELDGFDVDLEGSAVAEADTLGPCITYLMNNGYTVTAAPEAAQQPLDHYKGILPQISWVHPQFYNNGPDAVTTPWTPAFDGWCGTPRDWQDPSPECYVTKGSPWWVGVLQTITGHLGMDQSTQGMLIPTTRSAASNNNNWDIGLLKRQVEASGVTHVGTWAIAYDNTINYAFAKAIASIMDPTVRCSA